MEPSAGQLLRETRERNGLSQRSLAYRAATNQSAISRIEAGEVSPTVETLERLFDAMGEELAMEASPRGVPYEEEHFARARESTPGALLARGATWNRFAGRMGHAVHEAWRRG